MADIEGNALPRVSVIVPVFNAERTITGLIESLLNQDYPAELLEVIVVDNNSTDRSRRLIDQYPVRFLDESRVQSSYAARNRGIEAAEGEVFAFIDSDCRAECGWVKVGVRTLNEQGADLAGGRVRFEFSARKTAAECYDALTQMDTQASIESGKVAATANLFVRARLFEVLGPFPEVKSGGDYQWTSNAVANSYKLVYAADAVVMHPTRRLGAFLKKGVRIGGGTVDTWVRQGRGFRGILGSAIMLLKPPRFAPVKKLIAERGTDEMLEKAGRIWFVRYLWNISKACGVLGAIHRALARGPVEPATRR